MNRINNIIKVEAEFQKETVLGQVVMEGELERGNILLIFTATMSVEWIERPEFGYLEQPEYYYDPMSFGIEEDDINDKDDRNLIKQELIKNLEQEGYKPSRKINYDFTCPQCGEHVVEEVMNEVTQTSVITNIEQDEHGIVCCDYDQKSVTTEGGDVDTIHYQCSNCGCPVELEEILA